MCVEGGLSYHDMAEMNISDALDYCFSWIEYHDPDKKPPVKLATQKDIDRF